MYTRNLRTFFIIVLPACFSFLVSGAQPVVKTSVDKTEILIGDQFKLTIEASFSPEDYSIKWPVIPDSLSHFEVVTRGKTDSVYNNNRLTGMAQTITLTSFDSGKWILPSFLVNITPAKADTSYSFFTDSVPVTVSFSTSDKTSQIRDIKPIREADTVNTWWYWAGAAVLVVALILLLVWYYRYRKNGKKPAIHQSRTTPYEEAMKELQSLKTLNLSAPVDVKIVHTRLADILKRYLSSTQKNNYLNKTTGDILILLGGQFPEKEILTKAAAGLRLGDAVKFAKYIPPVPESEQCIASVKEVIVDIHQSQTSKSLSTNQSPDPKS